MRSETSAGSAEIELRAVPARGVSAGRLSIATIAALCGIVILAFTLRLIPVVIVPSLNWADEVFQTTEQAHRLVYGTGLVTWEFQLGTRSWILPGAIAALMELSRLIGDGPDYYNLSFGVSSTFGALARRAARLLGRVDLDIRRPHFESEQSDIMSDTAGVMRLWRRRPASRSELSTNRPWRRRLS